MRRFWDARAREAAFHFVDSRQEYGAHGHGHSGHGHGGHGDDFWEGGITDLDALLGAVGARIGEGDRVLEIGCGVGRLTRAIAARCDAVIALDVSEEMLAQARERNPSLTGVEWVLGDGFSLAGVEDASVDGIVSHVVFQHIPDPAITLGYVREMGRVLRPGGWAAFQVSNDPSVHERPGLAVRLRSSLAGLLRRGPRGTGDPSWLGSAVEIPALEMAAADGGLSVERVEYAGTQYCTVKLVS